MADVKEAAKPKKKYSTPWRPPNIMRAKPKPGMAQRWLSKERFRGDGSRVGDWEIDRSKHPELAKRMDDAGRLGDVNELPDLILCEMPQERLEERNAFFAAKCKTRNMQANADLKKEVKAVGGEVFELDGEKA